MLPGPVFNAELMTTARRGRYHAARTVYGLILFTILWQSYEAMLKVPGGVRAFSPRQVSSFAQGTFVALAITQGIAILLLTPALFAGAIADEKQRRTLLYLLSSRLSSAEIVLGKLAARLLHVVVTLAMGLPILSLMTLLGGVAPAMVLLVDLATATTAFLLAGLSLLVSTHARKVREAVLVVYLIELAWLVGLPLLDAMLDWAWPAAHAWAGPLLKAIQSISPIGLAGNFSSMAGSGSMLAAASWTMGLQMAVGAGFVMIAVARLRPVYRAQSNERATRGEGRTIRCRWLARRGPGDAPMLWKEMHVGRVGGLHRWVVRGAGLLGLLLVGYWGFLLGGPAWNELLASGYGMHQSAREEYSIFVRISGGVLYSVWTLAAAAGAAASVTSEREEDTWNSLLATRLEPSDILLAKMAGALWRLRGLGGLMIVIWLSGVALGAVHPLGFVLVLGAWILYSGFAVALGTFLSLKSRSTTRATTLTVLLLIFLNGGYLLCCVPLRADTAVIAAGCSPFIMGALPLSYDDFWRVFESGSQRLISAEAISTCILSLLGYGVGAVLLVAVVLFDFDRDADRPRRGFEPQPPIPRKKTPDGGLGLDDVTP